MVAIKSLFAAAAAHYAGSWSSGSSGDNYGNYGKDANPGAVAGYDWSMQHHTWAGEGIANCKIDKFVPNFPHGQNQLVAPSKPPRFIGLAFGVQNYTCTPAGNYTCVSSPAYPLCARADADCHRFVCLPTRTGAPGRSRS